MVRTVVIGVCVELALCAGLAVAAPTPGAAAAGASDLIREAVATLSTNAMNADRVDWAALEARLLARLPENATTAQAHALIAEAVGALNDRHARFAPGAAAPAASASAEPAAAAEEKPGQATDAAALKTPAAEKPADVERRVPNVPEGRLLEGGVAYVLVPGCFAPDVDGLRRYARGAADTIIGLQGRTARGWIVDLRLNGGGNIWPMLLGLRPLLRDGAVSSMVRAGGAATFFGVDRDRAWMGTIEEPSEQLSWGGDAPRTTTIDGPVAVLMDRWTLSSGEGLAIALRVRPTVRFFGGPTGGLTTVTNTYRLTDGSTLILPVAHMGDAAGRTVDGALTPDETAEMGEWPSSDDAAVRAAMQWITKRLSATDSPRPGKP